MSKRKKALLQILKEDFLLFTMVTLKSIPPGRKVPKFTKTRQILKEDFLLFTMVTLKSIPPGRKVPKFTKTRQVLRNAIRPENVKNAVFIKCFTSILLSVSGGGVNFLLQILKEDFLLFTMVTLKSIPPGRKVPKFTKTNDHLNRHSNYK
ncbi:unnamed protein product [Clavelina lepadiformis]|uniref:Ribosomal protein S7 n=1 Tax=Clavelina lepadiformis TaxID=159417 RepID=A0ABP0G975_CLALP